MYTLLAFLAQVGSADDGLTFSELIDSLPTDPASMFVLMVIGFALAAIAWTNRPGGKGKGSR